ncbi:MAG: hypothetical protein AseanaTS_25280 [Candidatus Pelagadaptatus aseana]|uniref:FecR family protein n=1 Tax=Candidatus Pelagadaptatus aseana TaxID=3120508 RepID=UPI0039B205BD
MSITDRLVALLVALLLCLPLGASASESIGKVIVSVGKVEAIAGSGQVRPLKRRSQLFATDAVATHEGAKAQLRFSDGSMVALSANSLFKIEEYQFGGNRERAVYNLLKGGMQTITGAIGQVDKQDYVLKTPVATIGIRGTFYQVYMTPSGGMVGYVKEGGIVIENASGESVSVKPGQYFSMDSANQAATVTETPPQAFEDAEKADQESSTDNQSSTAENNDADSTSSESQQVALDDGSVTITTTEDTSESAAGVDTNPGSYDPNAGGSTAAAEGQDAGGLPGGDGSLKINYPIPGSADKALDGEMLGLAFVEKRSSGVTEGSSDVFRTGPDRIVMLDNIGGVGNVPVYVEVKDVDPDDNCNVCQFFYGSATLMDTGGDAAIGVNWGRWEGNFKIAENGVELDVDNGQNFHYIYSDKLTSYIDMNQLDTTATFNYVGGPKPTDQFGNVTGSAPTVSVQIDFAGMKFIDANVQFVIDSVTYTGALVNDTLISTDLTTELELDNGRMNAAVLGQNPVSLTDVGVATTYELKDPGTGRVAVGASFLK